MKDTDINLVWYENVERNEKILKRNAIFSVFSGLSYGFEGDNMISQKLILNVIPEADTIIINKDHNSVQDIPGVVYRIGDEYEIIKIMRCHKIVWAILDKYCS